MKDFFTPSPQLTLDDFDINDVISHAKEMVCFPELDRSLGELPDFREILAERNALFASELAQRARADLLDFFGSELEKFDHAAFIALKQLRIDPFRRGTPFLSPFVESLLLLRRAGKIDGETYEAHSLISEDFSNIGREALFGFYSAKALGGALLESGLIHAADYKNFVRSRTLEDGMKVVEIIRRKLVHGGILAGDLDETFTPEMERELFRKHFFVSAEIESAILQAGRFCDKPGLLALLRVSENGAGRPHLELNLSAENFLLALIRLLDDFTLSATPGIDGEFEATVFSREKIRLNAPLYFHMWLRGLAYDREQRELVEAQAGKVPEGLLWVGNYAQLCAFVRDRIASAFMQRVAPESKLSAPAFVENFLSSALPDISPFPKA